MHLCKTNGHTDIQTDAESGERKIRKMKKDSLHTATLLYPNYLMQQRGDVAHSYLNLMKAALKTSLLIGALNNIDIGALQRAIQCTYACL